MNDGGGGSIMFMLKGTLSKVSWNVVIAVCCGQLLNLQFSALKSMA
jgi:hypothetical protein